MNFMRAVMTLTVMHYRLETALAQAQRDAATNKQAASNAATANDNLELRLTEAELDVL
jgi:hypothetical protein